MRRVLAVCGVASLAACAGRLQTTEIDLPPVVDVEFGPFHACALSEAGEVYCWGEASEHHIDDFPGNWTGRPGRVRVADGAQSLGGVSTNGACALHSDAIVCWWREGWKGSKVWRRELRARAVALAGGSLCWIDEEGAGFCEGWLPYHRETILLMGFDPDYHPPRPIAAPGPLVSISMEWAHGCVVASEGRVYCWGSNHSGQLGPDSPTWRNEDAPFELELDEPAVEVVVGEQHGCARLASGGVACWGRNKSGECDGVGGQPSVAPRRVPGVEGIVQLELTRSRTYARDERGRILSWGLGRQPRHPPELRGREIEEAAPAVIEGFGPVIDIAAVGGLCVVTEDGRVRCRARLRRQNVLGAALMGDPEAVEGEVVPGYRPEPVERGPWPGLLADD